MRFGWHAPIVAGLRHQGPDRAGAPDPAASGVSGPSAPACPAKAFPVILPAWYQCWYQAVCRASGIRVAARVTHKGSQEDRPSLGRPVSQHGLHRDGRHVEDGNETPGGLPRPECLHCGVDTEALRRRDGGVTGRTYHATFLRDDEAQAWCVSGTNFDGPVAEASTVPTLLAKPCPLVPELLELNRRLEG